MSSYDFKKTESWFLKSDSFTIEVKHWYTKGRILTDPVLALDRSALSHKWNVYVYVFPEHPFFDKLIENQNNNYPYLEELHYGCTYCNWVYDVSGKVKVKQYGSDYAHLHDEHFEDCDNENHPAAREIFFDAKRLYDSFKEAENKKQGEIK